MKKPLNTSPEEKFYERRRLMDDVYRPLSKKSWEPPAERPVSRRFAGGRGSLARNMVAVGMVATFLVSSVGVTYGRLPGTGAFFMDTETSGINRFFANFLDFIASSEDTDIKVVDDNSAIPVSITITPEAGSVETDYRVTVEQTGGNTELCNALQASIPAFDSPYSGPLMGVNNILEANTALTIDISLPGPVSDPAIPCLADIVLRGFDARVPGETGYFDEERISMIITDPPVSGTETHELTATVDVPTDEPETPPEEAAPQEETATEEPPAEEPPAETPPVEAQTDPQETPEQ